MRLAVLVVTLFVLATVQVACAARDFYKILGVSKDASEGEIKKAYRKLSLQWHPDKHPNDEEAHQKFVNINEAYEILSNPEKRQLFDMGGEEGLKNQGRGGGGGAVDPFEAFFGGGGRRSNKGPDSTIEYSVTLEDLYNGAQRVLNIQRMSLCKKCRGTGAKDGALTPCKACGGKGHRMTVQQLAPGFNVQMQTHCDVCGGRGHTAKSTCPICGGHKRVKEDVPLDVFIEKGMPDGHQIVFERQSEQFPDTVPGDVIVRLRTAHHHRFTRKGNDLYMTLTISLRDALLGFSTSITHLDGRRVTISQTGVTSHESVKVIKGEGMPIHDYPSDKGDMHVTFHIRFPDKLTPQQQQVVTELF